MFVYWLYLQFATATVTVGGTMAENRDEQGLCRVVP